MEFLLVLMIILLTPDFFSLENSDESSKQMPLEFLRNSFCN